MNQNIRNREVTMARHGKKVYAVMTDGPYKVWERIPLHVIDMPRDKQQWFLDQAEKALEEKMIRLQRAYGRTV